MTEYDAQLRSALARLAPRADDTPAWDDVVERASGRLNVRARALALALAVLVTAAVVAGAVASGLLQGTLDHLSAWAGDQPGEPAPEQQSAFDSENAASYAHFPSGTRVGRLLSFDLHGGSHDLLGFRDGSNLCLRIVPSPIPPGISAPECVPQRELDHLREPMAVVGGLVRRELPDGSGVTMLYGLAADDVRSIDVLEGGKRLGSAVLKNNGFVLAAPDHPGSSIGEPALVVRARDAKGASADLVVDTGPNVPGEHPQALPGPDRVERTLTSGSIGWLENGESRGEPIQWPDGSPRTRHAQMLEPDPSSSLRLVIADTEERKGPGGKMLCLGTLWPLVRGSFSSLCSRADTIDSGFNVSSAWADDAQQFPLWTGIASDEVSRIELFFGDDSTEEVSLRDNVFAFYARRGEAVKLVAYDHEGRVVKIEVVGGSGSGPAS